jgi:large subunit ribosomal protein L23
MIRPLISEKSVMDAQKGKFTFRTEESMNKNAIAAAVHDQFNVDVVAVATTIVKGRGRRSGMRRIEKIEKPWKKAIVRLKAGQKISIFDIGEQK